MTPLGSCAHDLPPPADRFGMDTQGNHSMIFDRLGALAAKVRQRLVSHGATLTAHEADALWFSLDPTIPDCEPMVFRVRDDAVIEILWPEVEPLTIDAMLDAQWFQTFSLAHSDWMKFSKNSLTPAAASG